MKYYLLPLAALAFFAAASAYAEETGTSSKQYPGFYQNAIERAELRKQELEARDALFMDFKNERGALLEERKAEMRALLASSTPQERRAFLEEAKEARHALLLTQKDERHEFFVDARGQRRELAEEHWQERKDWFSSTTAPWKEGFSGAAKEAIGARADTFASVFGRILERLSSIADRIEGRIDELAADGIDVSASAALLETADAKLLEAADAVDAVIEAMEDALASEDPKAALADVKALKDAAKIEIREAHAALKAAAASLPKTEEATEEE
jgi:hypothetical protein